MLMEDITEEWLEVFENAKAAGEDLSASAFFRLSVTHLPLGVNGDDPRVKAAIAEIERTCSDKAKKEV